MSGGEFTLAMVDALAWPIAVLVVGIVLIRTKL